MYTIKVRSHQREELVEFTAEVQSQLKKSGAREGIVVLYVQHTTAGLTVNENADPDVPRDLLHLLRTLIPQHGMGFRHGEENSDAHIKASLVGSTRTYQSQPRRIHRDHPVHRRRVVAGALAGNLSLRIRRRPRAQSDYDG